MEPGHEPHPDHSEISESEGKTYPLESSHTLSKEQELHLFAERNKLIDQLAQELQTLHELTSNSRLAEEEVRRLYNRLMKAVAVRENISAAKTEGRSEWLSMITDISTIEQQIAASHIIAKDEKDSVETKLGIISQLIEKIEAMEESLGFNTFFADSSPQ